MSRIKASSASDDPGTVCFRPSTNTKKNLTYGLAEATVNDPNRSVSALDRAYFDFGRTRKKGRKKIDKRRAQSASADGVNAKEAHPGEGPTPEIESSSIREAFVIECGARSLLRNPALCGPDPRSTT